MVWRMRKPKQMSHESLECHSPLPYKLVIGKLQAYFKLTWVSIIWVASLIEQRAKCNDKASMLYPLGPMLFRTVNHPESQSLYEGQSKI